MSPPEPHPLDYDWRYTFETTTYIGNLLKMEPHVLAIGAPSVARVLQTLGTRVTLVDRQPLQGVFNHWTIDPSQGGINSRSFSAAVVDPPWYPADFEAWVTWAAQHVVFGGRIIVSIWPNRARPTAAQEAEKLFYWMNTWAKVLHLPITAHYEQPLFEQRAQDASRDKLLATSPRCGNLLELTVDECPKVAPYQFIKEDLWRRFVFNDYQLALHDDGREYVDCDIVPHPKANGWLWPYVSRRAPGRGRIGIWSSRNEVAMVKGPGHIAEALRRASRAPDKHKFEAEFVACPALLEWEIPRPPFWRFTEWNHRQ